MSDKRKKSSGSTRLDLCEIPMWAQLKSQLSNLGYSDFFEQAASDPSNVLLDVRTEEEFRRNIIPGARNISYLSHHLADELEELPTDLTYYVFCRTGRRSLRVCVLMKNAGYDHVFNLEDGMISKDEED